MNDWFKSSLGRALLEQERQHCRNLVPSGYYPRSLQVGQPSVNFLDDIEASERFMIDASVTKTCAKPIHYAAAKSSAMPFADKTHNLIVLPHTLDFCTNPHGVLREVNHILVPQGCLVITGFNGFSLWGAIRLLMKSANRRPWNGRYRHVSSVQDWLALLGFELVGAAMLAYQPPLQSKKWRRKLAFIDHAGARWWPGLGAVYVIVGRKKEIAVSGREATRMQWRKFLPPMAQPAARVELKLVRTK